MRSAGNQRWSQASTDIQGEPESGDGFGSSLAAADLDRNTLDDLAIGVPYETVGALRSAGAVNVLYSWSFSNGLGSHQNEIWTQGAPGVDSLQTEGVAEEGDWFGYALIAFTDGGNQDYSLAVGVPGESVGDLSRAGAVVVIRSGLNEDTTRILTQEAPGVDSVQTVGVAEADDFFGASLGAGTFNSVNGEFGELLVIDVPFESVGDQTRAGAIVVPELSLVGVAIGPPPYDHQTWTQGARGVDSFQVEGVAERDDGFGFLTGSSVLRPQW